MPEYDNIMVIADSIITLNGDPFTIHNYDSPEQLIDELSYAEHVELDINNPNAADMANLLNDKLGIAFTFDTRRGEAEACPQNEEALYDQMIRENEAGIAANIGPVNSDDEIQGAMLSEYHSRVACVADFDAYMQQLIQQGARQMRENGRGQFMETSAGEPLEAPQTPAVEGQPSTREL